jgi:hypothetical protein
MFKMTYNLDGSKITDKQIQQARQNQAMLVKEIMVANARIKEQKAKH